MSLLGYHSHQEVNTDFWRELSIAIDSINDLSREEEVLVNRMQRSLLNRMTLRDMKELAELYNVETAEPDITKENLIQKFKILSLDLKKEILILHDFLNRKKRAIDDIYNIKVDEENRKYFSSLACLKQLYDISPKLLMESFTYYHWKEKGTGNIFTFNKDVSFDQILRLTNEYKSSFPDELYKKANQNHHYKLHSYCILEKELILNIYKQVNDTPRPDFDRAIRNKEVTFILIRIDIKQNIVEVKGANKTDDGYIISYLEETFSIKTSKITSEVFSAYNPEEIREAVLLGKPVSKDKENELLVTRISFRNSLLKRSPSLTIELDNESIWPSVIHAYQKDIISLTSIKDISHIHAQIENKSRLIRNTIFKNGNVIFSFDDSRMDYAIRERFIQGFSRHFGVPLFQEISNYGFFDGKADRVDYLMSISNPGTLSSEEKLIFEELVSNKIMKEKNQLQITCKSCGDVTYIEDMKFDSDTYECGCGHTECILRKISSAEVDLKTITSVVKKKFMQLFNSLGYVITQKSSTININEEKYQFVCLQNEETNETLQLFITSDHIRSSFIKRLTTMMTPTLIITVGMVEETVQSLRDQGVYPINFGTIYLSEESNLETVYQDNIVQIQLHAKSNIAKAADLSFSSLKRTLGDPSKADPMYTDKIFEDDVFALLKDMIPNGEKWGKEKSGKAFPEGIFAISAKNSRQDDLRRVFSYDCKYTKKDDGYDLKKEEQRKAVDYVEKLNDSDYIINYSDKKELTAHIFISNRFQEPQKDGMRDYFNEKLGDDYNTKPIFLNVECLLYLHESYRRNLGHIQANRNRFYEQLNLLFTRENITKQEIDKIFEKVLDKDLEENKVLDTKKVTNSLEDK